jgi:hypothetical protein
MPRFNQINLSGKAKIYKIEKIYCASIIFKRRCNKNSKGEFDESLNNYNRSGFFARRNRFRANGKRFCFNARDGQNQLDGISGNRAVKDKYRFASRRNSRTARRYQ